MHALGVCAQALAAGGLQGPLWEEAGAAPCWTQPTTMMKKQRQKNFMHQLIRNSAYAGLQELAWIEDAAYG